MRERKGGGEGVYCHGYKPFGGKYPVDVISKEESTETIGTYRESERERKLGRRGGGGGVYCHMDTSPSERYICIVDVVSMEELMETILYRSI